MIGSTLFCDRVGEAMRQAPSQLVVQSYPRTDRPRTDRPTNADANMTRATRKEIVLKQNKDAPRKSLLLVPMEPRRRMACSNAPTHPSSTLRRAVGLVEGRHFVEFDETLPWR
jgi:hypothetical protein